jgi:glycosyltransferase involved in cell wall biosynthesis
MLVRWKVTDDPDVRVLADTPFLKMGDKIAGKIGDWTGRQYFYYPSTSRLPAHPWFKEATVLQLHNLHGNFFAYPKLVELSRLKPTFWLLHDMWSFTAHSAYAYDCLCWKKGPAQCTCPLSEYPPLRWNTSELLWKKKQQVYEQSKLTIITPSRWLSRLAQESPLLGRFNVHTIPYGLDTQLYRPIPKDEARRALGLPADAKILLFGSQVVDDPRKGAAQFKAALESIPEETRRNWTVVTIGSGDARSAIPAGMALHPLGGISDERRLALAYAAADIFVLPTLADNLPNTILESLSCGTPVVSFRVGGVPDAVRHMETGYIAAEKDVNGLAEGLVKLMNDADLRKKLSANARRVAESEYDIRLITKQYTDLYGRR